MKWLNPYLFRLLNFSESSNPTWHPKTECLDLPALAGVKEFWAKSSKTRKPPRTYQESPGLAWVELKSTFQTIISAFTHRPVVHLPPCNHATQTLHKSLHPRLLPNKQLRSRRTHLERPPKSPPPQHHPHLSSRRPHNKNNDLLFHIHRIHSTLTYHRPCFYTWYILGVLHSPNFNTFQPSTNINSFNFPLQFSLQFSRRKVKTPLNPLPLNLARKLTHWTPPL